MTWTKASLVLTLISVVLGLNGDLTESDIKLTPNQQAITEMTANRADLSGPQNLAYASDSAVHAIDAAMADYTAMTCIRFVIRTYELDYVRFFFGQGCYSYVGRNIGPQDISIGRGCDHKGIVIHEIFHALGRFHEQSRPDRDMFVKIFFDNIMERNFNNFEIGEHLLTTHGLEYDFDSIMHYGSKAFSINGKATILPVNISIPASRLGQRQRLSTRDLQHVMAMYCPGNQSNNASWSSWGSWTACSATCNGGLRTRMRTCEGGITCEGSNIQSQPCITGDCAEPSIWSQWSSWGTCSDTCGTGRQSRYRRCIGGNNCVGLRAQFQDCNTQACPQPATWGSWGSWTFCSRTCQGGYRQRNRLCQNGNTCSGSSMDGEACNSLISCESQPTTSSEWSPWSKCSVQCGGGERYRTRSCHMINCFPLESEQCNTEACNPVPQLRGLMHHSCWFMPSPGHNITSIEGTTGDLMDFPPTRTKPVSKCGTAVQAIGKRFFALALGMCLVSDTDSLSDFLISRLMQCQDELGNGGFSFGMLYMDVYEISNTQFFSDSAAQVANTNLGSTSKPMNSTAETSTRSSGYNFDPNIVTIVVTVLLLLAIY